MRVKHALFALLFLWVPFLIAGRCALNMLSLRCCNAFASSFLWVPFLISGKCALNMLSLRCCNAFASSFLWVPFLIANTCVCAQRWFAKCDNTVRVRNAFIYKSGIHRACTHCAFIYKSSVTPFVYALCIYLQVKCDTVRVRTVHLSTECDTVREQTVHLFASQV